MLILIACASYGGEKSKSISGVEEDRRLRLDDRQGLWQILTTHYLRTTSRLCNPNFTFIVYLIFKRWVTVVNLDRPKDLVSSGG